MSRIRLIAALFVCPALLLTAPLASHAAAPDRDSAAGAHMAPTSGGETTLLVAVADPASDSAAVAEVVEHFHRALETADSAGVLALLADDAVVLESGGMETREEYRAHHLPSDITFARAVRREGSPIRVMVHGDVAWATSTGTTRGAFRNRPVNSQGAELMVLTRTPAGWRIAAIHWSSRALRT